MGTALHVVCGPGLGKVVGTQGGQPAAPALTLGELCRQLPGSTVCGNAVFTLVLGPGVPRGWSQQPVARRDVWLLFTELGDSLLAGTFSQK